MASPHHLNPEPHYAPAATLLVEWQRRWQAVDSARTSTSPAAWLQRESEAYGLHLRAVALIALGLAAEAAGGSRAAAPPTVVPPPPPPR